MDTALFLYPQKKYDQLMQEQKELADNRDDLRHTALQFKKRSNKLVQTMKQEQHSNQEQIQNEKVCLFSPTSLQVFFLIVTSHGFLSSTVQNDLTTTPGGFYNLV